MTPASPAFPEPSLITNQPRRRLAGEASHPSGTSSTLQSADLFKGQKSVLIQHNGAHYRLQTTRLGKLILTK
jgi:hemin uptake protein HemP